MTEIKKLEYTKSFIDKLANGINPLDDTPIPEGDLLNNARLSRCMFYVSDVLRQVIENGGLQKVKKASKLQFSIASKQLSKYRFGEYPTSERQKLGISYERRNGSRGEYEVVLYNKDAQPFILDNIEAVISLKYSPN